MVVAIPKVQQGEEAAGRLSRGLRWMRRTEGPPPSDRWSIRAARLAGPVSSTAGEESVFGARPMASSAAVSRYLHTPVQGCARVEHFHKRLAEISDGMRVSGDRERRSE